MAAETVGDGRPLNALIIGAGMYTCGRGTTGYGTVLPALLQAAKDERLVGSITACATSRSSVEAFGQKATELASLLNISMPLQLYPPSGTDENAFRGAVVDARGNGRPYDIAIVAVPDHKHYEISKYLLENDIHTLLVKPFVTNTQHGFELVRLADDRGLVGMVEFHKRWDQSNLVMRDALRAGKVGQPLYFHIEYSQRKCIPEEIFASWVRDTNIFQYLGVHYADMVYFLTEARPRRVMAIGQRGHLAHAGINVHDSMQTIVQWDAGDYQFVSTHITNWVDPNSTSAMSDQRMKVIGTKGRVECDQKDRGVQLVTDEAGIEHLNPYFSHFYGDDQTGRRFDGYGYHSFRAFLRTVQGVIGGKITLSRLKRALPTFRSSLVSTSIVEANNESLRHKNVWIDVEDVFSD